MREGEAWPKPVAKKGGTRVVGPAGVGPGFGEGGAGREGAWPQGGIGAE